jgi:DnaJ-class molecular chaperone
VINKSQVAVLRQRMFNHKTVNGMAIVELTACELQELLEVVDRTLCTRCEGNGVDHGVFTKDMGQCLRCKGNGMEPSWWKRLWRPS